VIEVDYAAVDKARLPARAAFKEEEGVALNYLPFVSRAVIDAIREYPRVNASVGDDELLVHHDINLSIAVDLELEGLVAPVVHGADGKRLRALAREIADLASRARERRLGPDDIAGGTFTITNPGPFGTLLTGAIINQPQVAILSTDGVKKRPVAVPLPDGSDGIAVHPTGLLAINFDHRAIDGAYAAAFLAKVKEILETRDWEAEIGWRTTTRSPSSRRCGRGPTTTCSCSSTRPSTPWGCGPTLPTCSSTRPRWGPAWCGPTGVVTSPTTGRVSSSATRCCRCPAGGAGAWPTPWPSSGPSNRW
jgi:2-oxoglutarate dehydrogenase E2 component (dihydrolipoamide succinyltransferase)